MLHNKCGFEKTNFDKKPQLSMKKVFLLTDKILLRIFKAVQLYEVLV